MAPPPPALEFEFELLAVLGVVPPTRRFRFMPSILRQVLSGFTALLVAFPRTSFMGPGHLWPYWIFLSNLGIFNSHLHIAHIALLAPTWSLAIEEQFYIAWSVVVRCVTPNRLIFIAALLWIGSIALRFSLVCRVASPPDINQLYHIFYFTISHLDGLCAGILSRIFYDNSSLHNLLKRFAGFWWIYGVGFVWLLVADRIFGWNGVANWYQPAVLLFGFTFLSLLFSAIILHGLLVDGWVRAVFEFSALKRMGAYSYCMYLFHMPIVILSASVMAHTVGDIGIVPTRCLQLALVIGFAHLSYIGFETPILSLKRFVPYQAAVLLSRRQA